MTLDALAEALASKIDVTWTPDRDAIAEALAQAERMGMERAAKIAENQKVVLFGPLDPIYNTAIKHSVAAIRAEMEKIK